MTPTIEAAGLRKRFGKTVALDGLDPRSRIDLWDAIRGLVEQGTDVLLTTQYLDEADHLASRIVIIDQGRAVQAGTPAELKRRAGRNVVEVHVRDRAELPVAAAALGALDHGEVQVDETTRRVSVPVEAGTDRLRDALRSLDAAGVTVDDISLRPPTLDEVFLALTGQPLEQGPDDDTAGTAAA